MRSLHHQIADPDRIVQRAHAHHAEPGRQRRAQSRQLKPGEVLTTLPDGKVSVATTGLMFPNGTVIIADELNNRIRQVSPSGTISTIAGNQMQALQVAFLVILPSILLSGFIFPQEAMPYPIYVFGQFVPVTYFIRILRGIILRDAGFMDLWQNGLVLAVMGITVLGLATMRFRKTLK